MAMDKYARVNSRIKCRIKTGEKPYGNAAGMMRRARGGSKFHRSNNIERAIGVKWGAEAHDRVGSLGSITLNNIKGQRVGKK